MHFLVGIKMTELKLPEESVLELLNKVSTAEKIGERQEIHRKKQQMLYKGFKKVRGQK